jgi:uncharacterized protein YeaO (DUF488 family)
LGRSIYYQRNHAEDKATDNLALLELETADMLAFVLPARSETQDLSDQVGLTPRGAVIRTISLPSNQGCHRPVGEGDLMARDVRLRRVYETVSPEDGTRVLVDRVWPRGLSKDAAHLDRWEKDIAPSTELRKWYGHIVDKFAEFRRRCDVELTDPERGAALKRLRALTEQGTVTLLTATKDIEHSQAAVLAERLRSRG